MALAVSSDLVTVVDVPRATSRTIAALPPGLYRRLGIVHTRLAVRHTHVEKGP
jgi:hypothetical protein